MYGASRRCNSVLDVTSSDADTISYVDEDETVPTRVATSQMWLFWRHRSPLKLAEKGTLEPMYLYGTLIPLQEYVKSRSALAVHTWRWSKLTAILMTAFPSPSLQRLSTVLSVHRNRSPSACGTRLPSHIIFSSLSTAFMTVLSVSPPFYSLFTSRCPTDLTSLSQKPMCSTFVKWHGCTQ